MVSFSIGILLGTAFLHLLPEAFESLHVPGHVDEHAAVHAADHGSDHASNLTPDPAPDFAAVLADSHASHFGNAHETAANVATGATGATGTDPHALFIAMFAGILILFFLEKFALYRHSHHFEGDGHRHEHGHDAREAGHGGALVLVGSAFHNFVDGILIAGAFLAGPWIGLAAALSIFAHEVPHKISDFIVLLHAGLRKPRAVAFALAASLCIVVGGLVGYFMLARIGAWIPYVLALAAANFLYIALSDLVPRAQRGLAWSETLSQVFLLACGILIVVVLRGGAHIH